ncbi:MAG TPA: TonB-dependent receptor [Candidatus Methylacidiphilales bacterium]|nr:TonB-dependent receptor [Candidatus Methylacidiphilales bacterium]
MQTICASSFLVFKRLALAVPFWAAVIFDGTLANAQTASSTTAPASTAGSQTTTTNSTTSSTTVTSSGVKAQPAVPIGSNQAVQMPEVTVIGQLDQARQSIVPSLGATVYTIDQQDIQNLTGGDNVPFSKLVLRFPGVSQDSAASGSFHVRDDHANVQYRIDDVLIPESITSFGSQFDTRFADSVDLITGALPAEYGFRQAGVLDIHTKNGVVNPGGDVDLYGGSYGTIHPSFEYGGSQGKLNYYFSGSYLQNTQGIENSTSSYNPIHDDSDQYRGFAYLSYIIDDTSRISLIAGEAYNQYEIPNTPGQSAATDSSGTPYVIPGVPTFDSADLNESQHEQNNFEVLAYQKTIDDFSFQLSLFNSYSAADFIPDWQGDLYFNGEAGSLNRSVMSNGIQFDGSYDLNEAHTIRGGLLLNAQGADQNAVTTVIPLNPDGTQVAGPGGNPVTFNNSDYITAYSYGFYLQDEWKITKELTLNYGGRMDFYQSSLIRQNQLSPRINAVYKFDENTTIHGGYASYFTPPPLENIPQGTTSEFVNTTGAATPGLPNDNVESERTNYFDAGVVHKFTPEYQVGLDGYYKQATNLIDDGQFGTAPILSAFNYAKGQICGIELSQSYTQGGFSAYANLAVEEGLGEQVNSAQGVLFNASDYAYIQNHYIYLDHSQTFTGSAGLMYNITQTETKPYLEMVCGSGLRQDIDSAPNGGSVPAYDSINVGFTQGFKWAGMPNLSARLDVVNVGDQIYQIRSGSGVGVFSAQYGQRRSVFAGVTYSF